jgi:membrane-associated phospholipid phosphatase
MMAGQKDVHTLRHDLSKSEGREFFLMAGLSWLITAASVAVALLAFYVSNFKFAPTLIPINLVAAFFALAVFAVYVLFRNDFFILSISSSVATISVFSSAGALFSYIAMHYSSSFDLWDATFASTDEIFYLDWPSLLRWVDTHRSIADILSYAYGSYTQQAIAVVIILSILGQYRRLQMLVLAFQISALSCSAIAAFMPAVGEYPFRKINPTFEFQWVPSAATSSVPEVMQLRTDTPLIPFDNFQGVITFPSFHAALGFLFLWAFWKTPVVRWIAFILNVTMIASTPIIGGHYFIDVVAGLLVAFTSILIARGAIRLIQRQVVGGALPHAQSVSTRAIGTNQ